MVLKPESNRFSERQFEFCFNHEFVNRYQAFFNKMPYIPNQNEEGDAGYDIRYVLREGGQVYSLFFQHKIPVFLKDRSPRYPQEWEFYKREYYYFRLHKKRNGGYEQHNMLVELARQGHPVFYSSPFFNDNDALSECFWNRNLIDNTVYIDPLDIGNISDVEPHRVSYTKNRDWKVAGFSSRLFRKIPFSNIRDIISSAKKVEVGKEYFSRLLSDLSEVYDSRSGREITSLRSQFLNKVDEKPALIDEKMALLKINYLLEKYYDLSWFMFLL